MTPAALTLDLGLATERTRARGDRPRTRTDRPRDRGDRGDRASRRDPLQLRAPLHEHREDEPRHDEPTGVDFEAAPPRPAAAPAHEGPSSTDHATHSELTLDELLSSTWDALTMHQPVTCPVCTGTMAPRYGSGALPVGGRCRRCGTSLG